MAYTIPNFNLTCTIWTTGASFTDPPRLTGVPCALVYGRRVQAATFGIPPGGANSLQAMNLLLQAGTDIRGPQDVIGFDSVEVPTGSGRYYAVRFVDDIGKGWPNEHRTASLVALDGTWTPPYP